MSVQAPIAPLKHTHDTANDDVAHIIEFEGHEEFDNGTNDEEPDCDMIRFTAKFSYQPSLSTNLTLVLNKVHSDTSLLSKLYLISSSYSCGHAKPIYLVGQFSGQRQWSRMHLNLEIL
jgi:hypothetical protein